MAELVDARASEARAPEAWEFESPPGDFILDALPRRGRCPAGLHKADLPGSIPGPGTCGWAGARPSFIRSEAEIRLPDPQLSVFMARYANWHRGQVESLVPVGSTPTRATDRISSRRLAAKTPVLQTG